MIETMDARKGHFRNKSSTMLVFCVFFLVLSQVDASLVDPSRIGMELQMFARDALGVDEMQVRRNSLSQGA